MSSTFDKETSYYERKKARQEAMKQLDDVKTPDGEDAVSLVSAGTGGGSTGGSGDSAGRRASTEKSTGNKTAISKARQFLWDEDEVVQEDLNASTSSFEDKLRSFANNVIASDEIPPNSGRVRAMMSRIPSLRPTKAGVDDEWSHQRTNLAPQSQTDISDADVRQGEEMLSDVRLTSRGKRSTTFIGYEADGHTNPFLNMWHNILDWFYYMEEYIVAATAGCCSVRNRRKWLAFLSSALAFGLLIYGITQLAKNDGSSDGSTSAVAARAPPPTAPKPTSNTTISPTKSPTKTEAEPTASPPTAAEDEEDEDEDDEVEIAETEGGEPVATTIEFDFEIINEARFEAIHGTIAESGFTDVKILQNPSTPQFKALRWLSDFDTGQIDVRSGALLQRYALAVLFFTTYKDAESHNIDKFVEDADDLDDDDEDIMWDYHDNWMSERGICMWWGVYCPARVHEGVLTDYYDENADIIKLNLTLNNVRGTIPREIMALENLETLDLSMNHLSGTIPPEIGELVELEYLYLNWNKLIGTLPEEIGNLEYVRDMHFGGNFIRGTIPDSILELRELRALGLNENYFNGALPNLSHLVHLMILYLDDNQFTGEIPPSYGEVTTLMDLRLSKNFIRGKIPTEIGRLSRLELLFLDDNTLSGTLPNIFDNLVRLRQLELFKNQFTGPLPPSISNLVDLRILYLDTNKFTGAVPEDWANLRDLNEFYLYDTNVTGPFPEALLSMKALRDLRIQNNEMTGSLPEELSELYELEHIYIEGNYFNGTIPNSLGELIHLLEFQFHDNDFTGKVSEDVCDLKEDFRAMWFTADCDSVFGSIECKCCDECYS